MAPVSGRRSRQGEMCGQSQFFGVQFVLSQPSRSTPVVYSAVFSPLIESMTMQAAISYSIRCSQGLVKGQTWCGYTTVKRQPHTNVKRQPCRIWLSFDSKKYAAWSQDKAGDVLKGSSGRGADSPQVSFFFKTAL